MPPASPRSDSTSRSSPKSLVSQTLPPHASRSSPPPASFRSFLQEHAFLPVQAFQLSETVRGVWPLRAANKLPLPLRPALPPGHLPLPSINEPCLVSRSRSSQPRRRPPRRSNELHAPLRPSGGLLGLCLGLRLGLTVIAAPTPASVASTAASRWNRDLGCCFSSSFSGVLFFLIFALPSPKRSWASHGPPPLLRFPLLRRNP